ncbi:MAG: serine/threonine protein kinase [Thaumarchaeota archaeon]|nr:serine/threonine protein kinase [Nitrososphaerota archaeon]
MSATSSERAELAELIRTPYIRVLTYPKISLRTAKARIRQLERLGVEELVFEGHTRIGRLGILGLGTVGVVVTAITKKGESALKIRRTDANREDMDNEVKMTRLVNRVGIGPEIQSATDDFILMTLIRYEELEEWVRGQKGRGTKLVVASLLHSALNQCRKLDILAVDHGQLNNLRKHLVVADGRPWIIDFESAGTNRRPRNVTSAAQHLFVGGSVSPYLRRLMGIRSLDVVLDGLTAYKREPTDYMYSKLLEHLKLVPNETLRLATGSHRGPRTPSDFSPPKV